MATVNRFSPIAQPTVFNPISVEQFSLIPLARAEAKTNAMLAASSYNMQYNVDEKDEGVISAMVGDVHSVKNSLVDRIAKEGISDNLMTDFINLKQNYQSTKSKVKIAEQNKNSIDRWKQEVFKLHADNPAYMDLVINKEYKQGWQGSFNTDGSSNSFDRSRGPQSFSIQKDFEDALSGIQPEALQLTKDGTRFKVEKLPDNSMALVAINSEGKVLTSNKSDVVARLNSVLTEYKDTLSRRGAFKDYVGYTDEYIAAVGAQVAESMIKESETGGGSRKTIVKDLTAEEEERKRKALEDAPPTDPIQGRRDLKLKMYNKTDKVLNPDVIAKNPLVEKTVSGVASTLNLGWNIFKRIARKYSPVPFLTEDDTKPINESVIDHFKEMISIDKKYKTTQESDIDAQKIALGNGYYNDYNNAQDEFKQSGVIQSMTPTEKAYREKVEKFKNEAVKNGWVVNGNLTAEGSKEFYDQVVVDRVEDDLTSSVMEVPFNSTDYLENDKLGLKNDVKDLLADKANSFFGGETTEGEGSNILVMGLNSKRIISDKDDLVNLQEGLLNYDKTITEGYYVVPRGNATAYPKVYNSLSNGKAKFEEQLVYGDAVTLYKKDKDGKSTVVADYLVGTPTQFRENKYVKENINKLKTLANLNPGEAVEVGYTVTGADGKPMVAHGSVSLLANDKVGVKNPYANPDEKITISKNNYAIELYDDNGNVVNRFPYTIESLSKLQID